MSSKKLNPSAPSFVPKKYAADSFEEIKEKLRRCDPSKAFADSGSVAENHENEILSEYLQSCMNAADLSDGPSTKNLVSFIDTNHKQLAMSILH